MYVGLSSLGLNTAPFAVSPITSLFRSGEPGAVFIAQKPSDLYARTNLVTNSEGTAATLNISSGVTTAGSSIAGFASSIQFAATATSDFAYRTFLNPKPGGTYTVSAYIQMDDNSVPIPSALTTTGDFCFQTNNGVFGVPTVTSVGNNVYRLWLTFVHNGLNANGSGIVRYSTQSAKGFRVTGYQIEASSTMSAYVKVTDWTTEYLARAGNFITQYTLADGSVPVMNLEDPVGLHLDTRPYFGSNAELASANYTPLVGGDNTVSGVTASGFTSTFVSITPQVYGNITTVIGRTYKFTFTVASSAVNVSAVVRSAANGGGGNISTIPSTASGGTTSIVFTATTTASSLVWAATTGNFTISGITCKEYVAAPNSLGQPLRGSELVTNGSNFTVTTGWAASGVGALSVVGGKLRVTASGAGLATALFSGVFTDSGVGRYTGTMVVSNPSGRSFSVFARGASLVSGSTATTLSAYGNPVATNNNETISLQFTATTNGDFIEIGSASVKLLYGNHRSQSTAGARAVLSARYNKVTARNANPVDLTNATLANATNGLATLTIVNDAAALAAAGLTQCTLGNIYKLDNTLGADAAAIVFGGTVGNTNRQVSTCYVRGGTGSVGLANSALNPQTPFGSSASYVRRTNSVVPDLVGRNMVVAADAGQIVFAILPDLRENCYSYLPTPQVVWDATTGYDDSGFPARIKYSGAQGYATANIDFTGSDKAQVFWGGSKLSDAASTALIELSPIYSTNAGSFALWGPLTALANFAFAGGGTANTSAVSGNTYASPNADVVSGSMDIAGALNTLRVNGVLSTSNNATQGTGTLGSYALNYGARSAASAPSLFLTGDEFVSVVRSGAIPATGTTYSIEQAVGRYMGLNI